MNCKQGEMAFVVGSEFGDNGLIVTCLRRLMPGEAIDGTRFMNPGETWVTDKMLTYSGQHGYRRAHIAPDEALRPIRDPGDDATDESHAWLPPVPTKEREHA
jgi:hypothetical protein